METKGNFKYTSELIIKFLKNDLTDAEMIAFEQWLAADQKNRDLLDSFKNTEAVQAELNFIHTVDTDLAWANVSKLTENKPAKAFTLRKTWSYSAAAVLLIVASFGLYKLNNKTTLNTNEVATIQDIMPGSKKALLQLADGSAINLSEANLTLNAPNGKAALGARNGTIAFSSKRKLNSSEGYNKLSTPRAGEYKMILPDGTKVWLNASSSLRFPSTFNQTERRVELTGEAYFEVKHNKKLPFRVFFNQTEVEVLGTHFNISSFGDQSKTTLLEGSVKIKDAGKQQMLVPGEEATIGAGTLDVHKTDTYKSIAWKEGAFYFKDDLIPDVMNQIFRWYDVEVIYKGIPDQKRYSGNIRRQATLNQVLEMLNAVSGKKFELKGRTVTVDFNP